MIRKLTALELRVLRGQQAQVQKLEKLLAEAKAGLYELQALALDRAEGRINLESGEIEDVKR